MLYNCIYDGEFIKELWTAQTILKTINLSEISETGAKCKKHCKTFYGRGCSAHLFFLYFSSGFRITHYHYGPSQMSGVVQKFLSACHPYAAWQSMLFLLVVHLLELANEHINEDEALHYLPKNHKAAYVGMVS